MSGKICGEGFPHWRSWVHYPFPSHRHIVWVPHPSRAFFKLHLIFLFSLWTLCASSATRRSVTASVTHYGHEVHSVRTIRHFSLSSAQWRRQDLSQGRAKLEIMSWGTHDELTSGPGATADRWLIVLWLMQYWSKELWVVDICIPAGLADYTILGYLAVRFTPKSTKNEMLEVGGGGTCPSAP